MFESIDPIITFELIRIHTQFYPYKINILTKFSLKIRRNHFYFSTKNWRHDLFWEMDTTKNTPSSPSKPCLYSPLYSLWPAVDNQVTTFENGEPIVRAFSRPWRVNRFVAQSILIDAARFWTIRIPKNTSRALSWPSLTSLVVFFLEGPTYTHTGLRISFLFRFSPLLPTWMIAISILDKLFEKRVVEERIEKVVLLFEKRSFLSFARDRWLVRFFLFFFFFYPRLWILDIGMILIIRKFVNSTIRFIHFFFIEYKFDI